MPETEREILIDVGPAQTRVAVLENGRAAELYFEARRDRPAAGDVYLGRVSRVLPGMQAAFVDLGFEKDAFLYAGDVRGESDEADEGFFSEFEHRARPSAAIDELLREGQEILVQIVKEPLGEKGARVTTNLSLPGRLLVLTPFSARIGISRRIGDEAERERLRELLEKLGGAEKGFIARTAAQGRDLADIEADRRYLEALWGTLQERARSAAAPSRIHREEDLVARAVRDFATAEIAAIRVNDPEAFARTIELLHAIEPSLAPRVHLHRRRALFFEEFGVEAEIEKAMRSKVWLKSGGYVVINPTEALVAIDVNSGKFVGRDSLEETVLAVNLEAAREIARQIRLRDLGGILVIDFIDMQEESHRTELYERFEEEMRKDRARSRILEISEFGLIQVTRKRSRASLERAMTRSCPFCGGSGRIKNDFTVAVEIGRAIMKLAGSVSAGDTVLARVRPEVGKILREDEPAILEEAERGLEITVTLQEDEELAPSRYEIAVV